MKNNIMDDFLRLNQDEIVFLAKQYENPILVGFPTNILTRLIVNKNMVENSLLNKGFVKEVDGKFVFRLQPDLLKTLFNPDRALIVVRNHTTIGIQKNIFCGKNGQFVLHLQPDEATHMIREVPAASIFPAVLDWLKFDFENLQNGSILNMTENEFEDFRVKVEKDGLDAVNLGETSDAEAKQQLANAIHTRLFSASVASLIIKKEVAEDALTFSLLVGMKSAWLFSAHPNQPGFLRMESIGKEFSIILQGIIRSVIENSQTQIQSYVLSEETLAYSLAMINRADIGLKLLAAKYGEIKEDKVSELFTKAHDILIRADLCKVNDTGHTRLNEQLERALFPMAMCDYMIRADISKPNFHRKANIYTQIGKHFTSVIRVADKLYLEHGKTSFLGRYLFNVYADFGKPNASRVSSKNKIDLDFLQDLMISGHDPARVTNMLNKTKLPDEIRTILAKDTQEQEYRGVIQVIEVDQKNKGKEEKGRSRKTILLMQSSERSWLFEFIGTEKNPAGIIYIVDRENFKSMLEDLLPS